MVPGWADASVPGHRITRHIRLRVSRVDRLDVATRVAVQHRNHGISSVSHQATHSSTASNPESGDSHESSGKNLTMGDARDW